MGNFVRPARVYDFTAFSRRTPGQQLPGDRLDAQFTAHADAIAELQSALARLDAAVSGLRAPKEATLQSPSLYVNAGGPYAGDDAGATATSADYAQVSIDWAEHMPDTIPPNILAINAISGDHWSSRWWANQAALIVASVNPGLLEQVAVTGVNVLAPLTHYLKSLATTQVIVNGRVFSGCVSPHPFTVSLNVVTWTSAVFSVNPGDEVVARYIPAS